ncbi:hypothetical protein PIB30_078375 [Stylosanthes scabra]|uniref:Uncharacterized protein n=1 Tax=Stylosanthes scabra TaxID=79078 RepID=A0ABU6RQN0_9FABA|nr:hypothetical protein [Stylosanthes scabra]
MPDKANNTIHVRYLPPLDNFDGSVATFGVVSFFAGFIEQCASQWLDALGIDDVSIPIYFSLSDNGDKLN